MTTTRPTATAALLAAGVRADQILPGATDNRATVIERNGWTTVFELGLDLEYACAWTSYLPDGTRNYGQVGLDIVTAADDVRHHSTF